jgi:hypothetical protein
LAGQPDPGCLAPGDRDGVGLDAVAEEGELVRFNGEGQCLALGQVAGSMEKSIRAHAVAGSVTRKVTLACTAVWGIALDPRNFHRKATGTPGFLTPTGAVTAGDRGRPAQLYRKGPATVLYPPLLRTSAGEP